MCPDFVSAGDLSESADDLTGVSRMEETGLSTERDIRVIIARVIRVVLFFLGTLAVILIIYAGFVYMTSQGEADKVKQAKDIFKNAIIGLLIVLSAYAIVSFIFRSMGYGVGGRPGPGPGPGPLPIGTGNDVIETHYPARDARNIPRNTKIVVTFRPTIDPGTIIDDQGTPDDVNDDVLTGSVLIALEGEDPIDRQEVNVRTIDNKTFVFSPKELLGNPMENTFYQVTLGGQIRDKNGNFIFGKLGGQYTWRFEVGTFLDLTPPQVEHVVPIAAEPPLTFPMNIIVQITFNEPIDPIAASGLVKTTDGEEGSPLDPGSFSNARVYWQDQGKKYFDGIFFTSNEYKTIEFVTTKACGVNSCGEKVFCLPALKLLTAEALAATLADPDSGLPTAKLPDGENSYYNGIVDMCANSLDGNGDGAAQGPDLDNYSWQFKTSDEILVTSPEIKEVYPTPYSVMVPLDTSIWARFNRGLYSRYLNKNNVWINDVFFRAGYHSRFGYYNEQGEFVNILALCSSSGCREECANYTCHQACEETKRKCIGQHCVVEEENRCSDEGYAHILHSGLNRNTFYEPEMRSGIKDIYQNCFSDCEGPNQREAWGENLDMAYRSDLLMLKQALDAYGAKYGTYQIEGAGYQEQGIGFINQSGNLYGESILSVLESEGLINTAEMFEQEENLYLLNVCSEGRSYALSTRLSFVRTRKIDYGGLEVEVSEADVQKASCFGLGDTKSVRDPNIDPVYHNHNYALTNFNSYVPDTDYLGRDSLRKQDLAAIAAYMRGLDDLPGQAGYCNFVSELDIEALPKDPYEQVYKNMPHEGGKLIIKPYLYINFGDVSYAVLSELEYAGSDVVGKDYVTRKITKEGEFANCPNEALGDYHYCIGDCEKIPIYTSNRDRAVEELNAIKAVWDDLEILPGGLDKEICDGNLIIPIDQVEGLNLDSVLYEDPWFNVYQFDADYAYLEVFEELTVTRKGRALVSQGKDGVHGSRDDVYIILCQKQ